MEHAPAASRSLNAVPRDRLAAALDKLIEAARELLTVVQLVDEGAIQGAYVVRKIARLGEGRHDAAKTALRRAIADAETLRGAR